METIEYRIVEKYSGTEFEKELNELSRQGFVPKDIDVIHYREGNTEIILFVAVMYRLPKIPIMVVEATDMAPSISTPESAPEKPVSYCFSVWGSE